MKQVHITALSFESPLGNHLNTLAENLRKGNTGVRFLSPTFASEEFPVRFAAKLTGYDYVPGAESPYVRVAESLALAMASRLPLNLAIDGLVCAYRELNKLGAADPEGPARRLRETLARKAQTEIATTAMVTSEGVASAEALGFALGKLREGQWQRALVCAIELDTTPQEIMNYFLQGVLCSGATDPAHACRPFAQSRNGFVKGEAAALVLLESEAARADRKANSFGELAGYATANDGWSAMGMALDDAVLARDRVDYIKVQAAGLPADQTEIAAIHTLFTRLMPVGSLKAQLGNSIHAASLMEMICVLVMMRDQFVAPNPNLTDVDPLIAAHGLNLVGMRALDQKIETALLNSSDSGGQSACLVLKSVRE